MLISYLLSGLCAFIAVQASPVERRDDAASFPNPEPCSGNCEAIHDPNIIVKDGTFYRFTTGRNISIATASSISGPWTYKGSLLQRGTSIKVIDGQDIWAPDVSKVGKTYYAFYAVSKMGYQGSDIGVATSSSLDVGTWQDHGSLGLPKSSDWNLIDPNLFQESPTSPIYLTFGSYWRDLYQTTLANPPIKVASNAPANIEFNSTKSVSEGSYQFVYGQGNKKFYYLFFSAGACCNTPPKLAAKGEEYKIMVCRSQSATGPWTDAQGRNCLSGDGGSLVLGSHGDVYAPGGEGVMVDPSSGRPVIYYHYVKPSVGYGGDQFFFGWNYLDFGSGWPVVVN